MSALIYLACPYTHKDKTVMHSRFLAVNRAAIKLINAGHFVYSPISHCHPIYVQSLDDEIPLEPNFEFWMDYNYEMIKRSDAFCVLRIEGWDISKGVTKETAYAKHLGMPISYVDP